MVRTTSRHGVQLHAADIPPHAAIDDYTVDSA